MPKLKYLGTNGILEVFAATAGWLSLHGYAWNVLDCAVLDNDAPKRGGSGIVIPGIDGLDALPTHPTGVSYSLPMVITGDVDPAGVRPGANSRAEREAQLDTTLKYLKAQLTATAASADGTRPARLTLRNGDVRTANIHCNGITFVSDLTDGANRSYTFDIDIPTGRFV